MSPLASSSPVQPAASSSSSGFAKSFRELPARYRRKPLDETEIEYIQVIAYFLYVLIAFVNLLSRIKTWTFRDYGC